MVTLPVQFHVVLQGGVQPQVMAVLAGAASLVELQSSEIAVVRRNSASNCMDRRPRSKPLNRIRLLERQRRGGMRRCIPQFGNCGVDWCYLYVEVMDMRILIGLAGLMVCGAVAAAEPVYHTVTPRGDIVDFYAEAEPNCPGPGGLKTTWQIKAGTRAGQTVKGCYLIRDEVVYMIYEDGDRYAVPLSVVKEMHEKTKGPGA